MSVPRLSTSSPVRRRKSTRQKVGRNDESPNISPSRPQRRASYSRITIRDSTDDESSSAQKEIERVLAIDSPGTRNRGRPRLSSIERRQRLEELRVKPDPEGFWDELRRPAGSDPIVIKLEDDEDLLRLGTPGRPSPAELPVQILPEPRPLEARPSRSFSYLLLNAIAAVVFGVAAFLSSRFYFQPNNIPIPYIAWSVGSNLADLRDVMKEMIPIHHLPQVQFHELQIGTFADEVERLGLDPEIADQFRNFIGSLPLLRNSVRQLDLRANSAFRLMSNDLIKAARLLQQLDPASVSGYGCKSQPDLCNELKDIVNRLHTRRIPKDISDVFSLFVSAHDDMARFTTIAEHIKTDLASKPDLPAKLGIVPPQQDSGIQSLVRWGEGGEERSAWEQNAPIQRRLTRAKQAVTVLQNVETLGAAFERTKDALTKYRKTARRYKDLSLIGTENTKSDDTLEDSMVNIDEIVPLLEAMLNEYQRPIDAYNQ